MPVKRDALDKAFSDAIREAYDFRCCHCEISYRHDPGYMHCAHVHTRKHRSTRWNATYGALALCAKCHRLLHDGEQSSDQCRCRDPFELLCKFQRGINGGSRETGSVEISGRHPLVTSSRTKSFSLAFNIFGLARAIMAFSIDIIPPFD